MDHASEPDGYEAYRLAGELFGRIQTAIKFGELTMHVNRHAVVYQWSFSTKRGRYRNENSVTLVSLTQMAYSAEWLARDIVDQWKESHRKASISTPQDSVAKID